MLLVVVVIVAGCLGPVNDVCYYPSSLITLHDGAKTLRFTLYTGKKNVTAKKGYRYYWFGNTRIHTTVGDYSGRLLDGSYTVLNELGGLSEKGNFDKGLKTGIWVIWKNTGDIMYRLKYSKGELKDTIQSKSKKDTLAEHPRNTTNVLPKEKGKYQKKKSLEKK